MGDERTKRSRFYNPETNKTYEVLKENEDYIVVYEEMRIASDNTLVTVYRPSEDTQSKPRPMILASWYIDELPQASAYDVAGIFDRLLESPAQAVTEITCEDKSEDRDSDTQTIQQISSEKLEIVDKRSSATEEANQQSPLESPRVSFQPDEPELPALVTPDLHEGYSSKQYVDPTEEKTPPYQQLPRQEATDENSFIVRCDSPNTVSITNLIASEKLRNIVVPTTIRGKNVTSVTLTSLGLETLDVSNCPHLQQLVCFDNSLRKLDLKMCPNLELLNCTDNPLKVLDIRGCSNVLPRYDSGVEVLQ